MALAPPRSARPDLRSRRIISGLRGTWPLLFAFALPLLLFALESHVGFGKADEGFLWYGAQRMAAGDIPLRDFQSYDIGRYLWSAAWMTLLGDRGLVALRLSDAVAAGITVAVAVALIRNATRDGAAWLALAAVVLTIWMVPEYKVADSFAAVLLVAGVTRLIARPGPRSGAAFGLCLGIAATIGINHALYGTIGGLLAIAWLIRERRLRIDRRFVGAVVGGAITGYLPVLAFALLVPGFAAAFVDAIHQLVEAGTTNVAGVFPDLTAVFAGGDGPFVGRLRDTVVAALYLAGPFFILACLLRIRAHGTASSSKGPLLAACALLAVPYAHYAYASPGTMHLAVTGLPLLVAAWIVVDRRAGAARAVVALAIVGVSAFVLLHARAGYQALRGRTTNVVVVDGDALRVDDDTAREVRLVQRLVAEFPGRAFYAAHDWPGAYAMFERRAPNWEIYAIFPSGVERQRREIARIAAAKPAFTIVTREPPGARPDTLDATHPLIAAWIAHCFVARPDLADPALPIVVSVAEDRPCAAVAPTGAVR